MRRLIKRREAYLFIGFGLYKGVAINAYSTGMLFLAANPAAPSTPYYVFETTATIAVVLLIGVFALSGRLRPWSLPYWIPTALPIIGYLGLYSGLFEHLPAPVFLAVLGALGGLGFGVLFIAWAELFSAEEATSATVHIALAFLVSTGVFLSLERLPLFLIPACAIILLLVSALCMRRGRRMLDPVEESTSPKRYRSAFADLADSFAGMFVLIVVAGMSAVVAGSGTHWQSDLAIAVPYLIFCLVVALSLKNPNPTTIYKTFFPVAVATLLLVPFFGDKYGTMFYWIMVMCRDLLMIATLLLLVATAHLRRVSSYVLVGLYWGGVRLSLLAGVAFRTFFSSLRNGAAFAQLTAMTFAAVFLLSMVLLFFLRKSKGGQFGESSEVVLARTPEEEIAERIAEIATRYGLTSRESEILGYFARGRSSQYISHELVLSHNTVRTHIKSAYSKLGGHTKQDLLDLIEKSVPRDSGITHSKTKRPISESPTSRG